MKKKLLLVILLAFLNLGCSVFADSNIDELKKEDIPSSTEQTIPQEETDSIEDEADTEEDVPKEKTYTQAQYEQIYQDLEVPKFSFVHNVDPDQYYDMKDTAWSPYPLMRLNSPIYFKSITIEPGYYLLTPRQYKGDWYVLFKEAGKVKYIIPAFERNYTDPMYYRNNLKEVEMKRSQRWMVKFLDGLGRTFVKSKRRPPIKTNLELTDLDNKFLLIQIYYGSHRYKTIFRVEKF